ncbi:MAG: hypothetical protein HY719_06215 [Planctomycetes bacterium]|nr:hypothetical protein [Planctomycetota bacterium]
MADSGYLDLVTQAQRLLQEERYGEALDFFRRAHDDPRCPASLRDTIDRIVAKVNSAMGAATVAPAAQSASAAGGAPVGSAPAEPDAPEGVAGENAPTVPEAARVEGAAGGMETTVRGGPVIEAPAPVAAAEPPAEVVDTPAPAVTEAKPRRGRRAGGRRASDQARGRLDVGVASRKPFVLAEVGADGVVKVEVFKTRRAVRARIRSYIASGGDPARIGAYESKDVKIAVKHTVRLA